MKDKYEYLSIKPTLREQAQQMATKHPQTFKNWQAVIKSAISWGLPCVGETINYTTITIVCPHCIRDIHIKEYQEAVAVIRKRIRVKAAERKQEQEQVKSKPGYGGGGLKIN